jgi:hypothetical protein
MYIRIQHSGQSLHSRSVSTPANSFSVPREGNSLTKAIGTKTAEIDCRNNTPANLNADNGGGDQMKPSPEGKDGRSESLMRLKQLHFDVISRSGFLK